MTLGRALTQQASTLNVKDPDAVIAFRRQVLRASCTLKPALGADMADLVQEAIRRMTSARTAEREKLARTLLVVSVMALEDAVDDVVH